MLKKRNISSQSSLGDRGFTLIEVMITAGVIAILASIAIPSFKEQIQRGRRADAQGLLLESAQWMERIYTQNNNYDLANFATSGFQYSPRNSAAAKAYYEITLTLPASPAQTFTLTATPKNSMSGDPCGNFVLTNAGQRSQTSNTRSDCWGK